MKWKWNAAANPLHNAYYYFHVANFFFVNPII